MQKTNINSFLMIIGFLLLLAGFFTNQKDTYDLHLTDVYFTIGQATAIRTLGILTVLNGLFYFLLEQKYVFYNRRLKYFGIILFFISFIITFIVVTFFSVPNGIGSGKLFSISEEQNSLAALFLIASLFTLLFSLLMPVLILFFSFFQSFFKK